MGQNPAKEAPPPIRNDNQNQNTVVNRAPPNNQQQGLESGPEQVKVKGYTFNRKTDKIGKGGFGAVFRGHRINHTNELVAIKEIVKKDATLSWDEQKKELEIMEVLTKLRHPNILSLITFDNTLLCVYLVTEFCSGGDLSKFIEARNNLNTHLISTIAVQITAALKLLKRHNIVHRDMSPQNILVCQVSNVSLEPQNTTEGHSNESSSNLTLKRDMKHALYADIDKIDGISTFAMRMSGLCFKLADFGISRQLPPGNLADTVTGKLMYMAPEVLACLKSTSTAQESSAGYDGRADVWSLGLTLLECIIGSAQLQQLVALHMLASNRIDIYGRILEACEGSLSNASLNELLKRMLVMDPRRRIDVDGLAEHNFLSDVYQRTRLKMQVTKLIYYQLSNLDPMEKMAYVVRSELEELFDRLEPINGAITNSEKVLLSYLQEDITASFETVQRRAHYEYCGIVAKIWNALPALARTENVQNTLKTSNIQTMFNITGKHYQTIVEKISANQYDYYITQAKSQWRERLQSKDVQDYQALQKAKLTDKLVEFLIALVCAGVNVC